MKRVGLLTLNKNIDNFFNENEQLAFSVAHVVPGERPRIRPPAMRQKSCTSGRAPLACAYDRALHSAKSALTCIDCACAVSILTRHHRLQPDLDHALHESHRVN